MEVEVALNGLFQRISLYPPPLALEGDYEGAFIVMLDQITLVIEDVLEKQKALKAYIGAVVDFKKLIESDFSESFVFNNCAQTITLSTNVREFVTDEALKICKRIDEVG